VLGGAWLIALLALGVQLGAALLDAALVRHGPRTIAHVPLVVARALELPAPGDPPLRVDRGRAFVVAVDDGWIALSAASTHRGCLVRWKPDQGRFVDPCHGSQFAPEGRWLQGPRYQRALPEGSRDQSGGDAVLDSADAPRDLDRLPLWVIDVEGRPTASSRPDGVLPGGWSWRDGDRVMIDRAARIAGTTR